MTRMLWVLAKLCLLCRTSCSWCYTSRVDSTFVCYEPSNYRKPYICQSSQRFNNNDRLDLSRDRTKDFIKDTYEMSPFVAWSRNTSVHAEGPLNWPGVDTVTN